MYHSNLSKGRSTSNEEEIGYRKLITIFQHSSVSLFQDLGDATLLSQRCQSPKTQSVPETFQIHVHGFRTELRKDACCGRTPKCNGGENLEASSRSSKRA